MKPLSSTFAFTLALLPSFAGPAAAPLTGLEIVQRSLANARADWAAAPQYNFTERDVIVKHGVEKIRTYQVLMVDGSPYYKLVAVDDRPLPSSEADGQNRKLQQEISRRQHEAPAARRKRIAGYQRERRQDHALMAEMVKAFDYKLTGQETVDGHRCFVLAATPRAGYVPISRQTKVLQGMRGTMWIDTGQYQWVKVHAEVFRPVAFGLFIAHVQPGTEFDLEQQPVEGNIWLPDRFSMRVNAKVLVFSDKSRDDESYSAYRRAGS